MDKEDNGPAKTSSMDRRKFIRSTLIGGAAGLSAVVAARYCTSTEPAKVFVGKADHYGIDLGDVMLRGFRQLQVSPSEVHGKTILLKPNLVEPRLGAGHINTHPAVVAAAAEAFLKLGADRVWVAEGPGHRRDTQLVLEVSGLHEALKQLEIPFWDLNDNADFEKSNASGLTNLQTLSFSSVVSEVDWIVSVAKLKTHHWAGVTLSMKNLFGLMPGIIYGWPKNVLHYEGIIESILDINATLPADFAIVDGIVGMEGDGPIMGSPRAAGVLVLGRIPTAVDATSARIMGIDPSKVIHLANAEGWLGPIAEEKIRQVGERPESVRQDFRLIETIPAQKGIRLF